MAPPYVGPACGPHGRSGARARPARLSRVRRRCAAAAPSAAPPSDPAAVAEHHAVCRRRPTSDLHVQVPCGRVEHLGRCPPCRDGAED
eukprot:8641708-Pyramimonas_sp.AAC.1